MMETNQQITQMWHISNKNFKAAIPLVFKDIKDHMFIVNEMVQNISREIENIKKKQRKFWNCDSRELKKSRETFPLLYLLYFLLFIMKNLKTI